MRKLTARQKLAIRAPNARFASFLRLGYPTVGGDAIQDQLGEEILDQLGEAIEAQSRGDIYLWNGSGIIEHDGHSWLGVGLVAGITGLESSTEPNVSQVGLVLAGVPGDVLGVADVSLKGHTATLYDAILTPEDRITDGQIVQDEIDLDYQTADLTNDGSFTITAIGQSGFWQLENASELIWSPETHKAIYPGDTGLDGLHQLEEYEETWTRT